jgi:hypothetical protein
MVNQHPQGVISPSEYASQHEMFRIDLHVFTVKLINVM